MLVSLLCAFVPTRRLRHAVRNCFTYTSGRGNKIIIVKNGREKIYKNKSVPGLVVHIHGDNNTVKIHLPNYFSQCFIDIDSNDAYVEIGENGKISKMNLFMKCGAGQKFRIGKKFEVGGMNVFCDETADISIGDDCLFSFGINIWGTDGHSIIDRATGKLINAVSGKLVIGNHCWIGQDVKIMKSACLPDNTIVGGDSVVTKKFDERYTVIAGNPARVIKTNVDWNFCNPYFYNKKK